MSFQTPLFWLFLAAVTGVFWLCRPRRLVVLAAANAIFYAVAGWPYLVLFMGVAFLTHICAVRRGRSWLWAGIGVNLLNLGTFKYLGFFLAAWERAAGVPLRLFGAAPDVLRLALPLGISFYTFQMIAYLLDVAHKRIAPARTGLEFWVFVAFFGQLVAGPIMRGSELLPQTRSLDSANWSPGQAGAGLGLIGFGLAKKLIIADTLAPLVDKLFALGPGLTSAHAWVAAYLFGFQIYYDFSAYSDIALGVGRLLGIKLTRNFDSPYLSASPREFWRRWHITLSTWIRDYLYIPLGGNRRGFLAGCVALVAATTLSGLWHGAAWTFVCWGLYHGLVSAGHRVLTRIWPMRGLRVISVLVTFHLVTVGWVLFRAPNISAALAMGMKMLTWSAPGMPLEMRAYTLIICLLAALHLLEHWAFAHLRTLASVWHSMPVTVRGMMCAVLIALLLIFTRPEPSSFIYFRF